MKGLSIEQKAQRYDEALEKSKRLYEHGTLRYYIEWADFMFKPRTVDDVKQL